MQNWIELHMRSHFEVMMQRQSFIQKHCSILIIYIWVVEISNSLINQVFKLISEKVILIVPKHFVYILDVIWNKLLIVFFHMLENHHFHDFELLFKADDHINKWHEQLQWLISEFTIILKEKLLDYRLIDFINSFSIQILVEIVFFILKGVF